MPGTVGPVPAPPQRSGAPARPTPDGDTPTSRHRWDDTPLGPARSWSPTLRTVVDLVLAAPVAMAFAYGPDLVLIFNDGFADLIGVRRRTAFARPAVEVLADTSPGTGEVLQRVYRTGEAAKETELVRDGADPTDQVVFTRSCAPVRDPAARVIGVLTIAVETTQVTRRLHSLGELAAALAATLTLNDVARVTLRFAAASFDADHVAFAVDDGPGWRVVRRVRGELLDEVDERLPPVWRRQPGDSPAPLAVTASGGKPLFETDGQPLLATAQDRHDQWIRSLAALPLRTATVRGAFTVGYRGARSWPQAERALLAAAAELISQAAERARRFETQHGTAQLLQRSMLPQHLPALPRMRIAARYDAGVDGNAAGGDFYDAFPLPGDRLAVVLGDVAGHDVQAAAVMGQVRASLRALALTRPDPATVLRGLDRLVTSLAAESRSDELFVTVVYGVIHPERCRFTLASAGHPAPLLRRGGTDEPVTARYVGLRPGAPLGLGGPRRARTVEFRPGDTVLLFSDGVVERRHQGLTAGFDGLAEAVAAAPSGDPRTLCAMATGAVPGTTEDDVAVLAVEYALAPSRSASIVVPAEPTGPGRVRHWMTDQLGAWRVPESVIGAAVLCTSELTTNALLHAGTAARVEIDLSPERLLVSVADSGTRGRVTRARTDALSSRGRGLGLIEQLSDAWGTDPTVRGSTVWFEMLIPGGQAGVTGG